MQKSQENYPTGWKYTRNWITELSFNKYYWKFQIYKLALRDFSKYNDERDLFLTRYTTELLPWSAKQNCASAGNRTRIHLILVATKLLNYHGNSQPDSSTGHFWLALIGWLVLPEKHEDCSKPPNIQSTVTVRNSLKTQTWQETVVFLSTPLWTQLLTESWSYKIVVHCNK